MKPLETTQLVVNPSISTTISNRSIAIFDTTVENWESLAAGVLPGTEVVVLHPHQDGVGQIAEILATRSNIQALHIVSHGSPGSLQLGSVLLNTDNLESYSETLGQWHNALSGKADILLYGCDVAAGEIGESFVQRLSEITEADIAASINKTGHAALGGDWDLEKTTGQIAASLAFSAAAMANYGSVLSLQPEYAWAKKMGGGSGDFSYNIKVDSSGNSYITGSFQGTVDFDPGAGTFNLTSTGGSDAFITKLDANGNFLWAKQLGGSGNEYGDTLIIDSSGNVYTTGSFQGTADFNPSAATFNLTSAGGSDAFISKLDASGNFLWAKQLGGGTDDAGYSITVDGSGNVYTTGHFWGTADLNPGAATFNLTSAGEYDTFISKLDASGNFLWAKQLGGANDDKSYEITLDSSGNIYTTGHFWGTADFNPGAATFNLTSVGAWDGFISKLDASGNFLWAKQLGGVNNDYNYSISVDSSGNVYTTGSFQGTADFNPGAATFNLTSAGGSDAFISKLDASGNFLWAKQLGGGSDDNSYSLSLDSSGNVYTTGTFQGTVDFDPGAGTANLTSAGGADGFISKLDASGNFLWAKQLGGGSDDNSYSLSLDSSGNVYTSGDFQGTADFDPNTGTANLTSAGSTDIFISKLNPGSAPTVTAISSAIADGTYKASQLIPITVTFSEPVTVTGTPTLALNTAATATYTSGSGTNTLSFNYTVAAGQNTNDLDYANTTALSLNGGTIKDSATNNAILTLPSPGAANSLGANKNLLVDTTAPTATSFTPVDNATNIAVGANLVVNFNEAIQKGTGNIVIKKVSDNSVVETIAVTDAKITVSGSTVTINPTADLAADTDYYVEIANGAIKDSAGNNYAGITGATAWNFKTALPADTTAPTATSFTPVDNATNIAVGANLVVNFNEAIQKGTGNIVIKKVSDNSVVETIAVTDAKITVSGSTVTINPTADLAADTDYYVEIANGAIKDSAGNNYAGITGATAWNFTTADTTAPTATSFTPGDNATNIAVGVNLVANFSETVQKGIGNIVIKKVSDNSVVETIDVTSGSVTASGSTVTINPSLDLDEATDYYVEIAAGAIKDLANNNYAGITGATPWNFTTADNTAPAVPVIATISTDSGTANDGITNDATLIFSGTAEANSTVTLFKDGTSMGTATADASGNWTFDYSGTTLTNGTYNFTATATDAASNISTPSAPFTVTIDTTAPTVTINQDAGQSDPTAGTTVNFEVVFSESVTGFDDTDITVGGTAGATTANVTGSGTTYNVAVTGMTSPGTITASVNAGAVTDVAGNTSTASTSSDNEVTYDNTIPTVTSITRADANPSMAATVNYTVTFSENVTGVNASDFSLAAGSIADASITSVTGSGSTYTVAVDTGTADGTVQINLTDDDTIVNSLSVPLGGSGTGNGDSTGQIYTVDKTEATVTTITSTLTDGSYPVGQVIPISVTFDEVVTVTGTPELTLNSGGSATYNTGSGTNTLTFNYTVATGDTATDLETTAITLAGGTITDAAGNNATLTVPTAGSASSLGGAKNLVIDTTVPTVTLASTAASTVNAPFEVSATFSETVTGFAETDISVTNGTVSSLTGSGSSYSFMVTPTGSGTVTVNVPTGGATDTAGNPNTAATALTRTADTTAPTVALASTAASTVNAPFEVSATFSETVTGFAADDVTVTNGTVSNLTGSGSNYSFTITPTGSGTVTVNVPAGGATDTVGNINTAATSLTRTADLAAPTVTLASTAASTVNAPFSVTATFSETVTGFAADDVSATNGTVSNLTGSGSNYSFTVTPTGEGTVTVNVPAGGVSDATGNTNSAAAPLTRTANTGAPTATSFTPADNATTVAVGANLVVNFNEAVQKGTGNIVIKKVSDNSVFETIAATDAKITVSGSTVTINPTSDLAPGTDYYVEIANGAIKDSAGNNYAGIVGATPWNFKTATAPDTTAPTATSFTPADNATSVAVGANLVVNFNEAVQKGTGNIVIKKVADNSVFETIAATDAKITVSGSTVTINPTNDLAPGTDYYVEIANGAIKDSAGNNYAGIVGATPWNFKTAIVPDTVAVGAKPLSFYSLQDLNSYLDTVYKGTSTLLPNVKAPLLSTFAAWEKIENNPANTLTATGVFEGDKIEITPTNSLSMKLGNVLEAMKGYGASFDSQISTLINSLNFSGVSLDIPIPTLTITDLRSAPIYEFSVKIPVPEKSLVFDFIKNTLGINSLTLKVGLNTAPKGGGPYAVASLDVNKNLVDILGFEVNLLGADFYAGINEKLEGTINLTPKLQLKNYDLTQTNEPPLNLSGLFTFEKESFTGGFKIEGGTPDQPQVWNNPFGLFPNSTLRGGSLEFKKDLKTASIGEVLISGDFNYQKMFDITLTGLAVDVQTGVPKALVLTANKPVNLFQVWAMNNLSQLPGSVYLAQLKPIQDAMSFLTNIIDVNIKSVDSDNDDELDPLLKFVPQSVTIGGKTIQPGFAIKGEVTAWEQTATLILEANPFNDNPNAQGSLTLPAINLGFLKLKGSSSDIDKDANTLNLALSLAPNNVSMAASANLELFGQSSGGVNAIIDNTKINIKNFHVGFGNVIALNLNNLDVNLEKRSGSASGELIFFGKKFAGLQINLDSTELTVKGNLGLGGLSIEDATLTIKNANDINIKGTIKLLGEKLFTADANLSNNTLTLSGWLGYNILGKDVGVEVALSLGASNQITLTPQIPGLNIPPSRFNLDSVPFSSIGDWLEDLVVGDIGRLANEAIQAIENTFNDVSKATVAAWGEVEEFFENVGTSLENFASDVDNFFTRGGGALNGNDNNNKIDGTEWGEKISGQRGHDILLGHGGNDIIYGGFDNDRIHGGYGNDDLRGEEGDDRISGEQGGDVIYGGTGKDLIYGDDGNDLLKGEEGDDRIYGGQGNDWIVGGSVSSSYFPLTQRFMDVTSNDSLYGNEGNDFLSGEGGEDMLDGGSGDDTLSGGGGNDRLLGETGNDSLTGESGNDELHGSHGQDSLYGGSGNDVLYGQFGHDLLRGEDGNDTLYGDDKGNQGQYSEMFWNNDTLYGDGGNDYLFGGIGQDYLYGGWDNDFLDGGSGNDFLSGESGNDTVRGDDGNDTLSGGNGNNVLSGGNDNDRLFSLLNSKDTISGGAGDDTLVLVGKETDYTFTQTNNGWKITNKSDPTIVKIVTEVEHFEYIQRMSINDVVKQVSNVDVVKQVSDVVKQVSNVVVQFSSFWHRGRVIDGYIADGQIFFDANLNGVLDDNEPFSKTEADGTFDLAIDIEQFDTNQDTELDHTEGQLVLMGGVDIATGLPLVTPLTSTLRSTVVTPLTTIIANLVQQGTDPAAAETQVKSALGLSAEVELGGYDPLEAITNGETEGVSVFGSMIQVQNTIVQMAKFMEGVAETPLTQLAYSGIGAIANQLKAGTSVDLGNLQTIQSILQDAMTQAAKSDPNINPTQLAATAAAAAQIMALGNQMIADLLSSGASPTDIITDITKLQAVSVGEIAVGLPELAAATISIEDFLAKNTKEAILARMEAVQVNDPTSRTLEENNPLDDEDTPDSSQPQPFPQGLPSNGNSESSDSGEDSDSETNSRNPWMLFFDADYYLAQNSDVAAAVETGAFRSAAEHFGFFGFTEGRSPSEMFAKDYLAQNTDVADAVTNGSFRSGFEHFLKFGFAEGRFPSEVLKDFEMFYVSQHADAAEAVRQAISTNGLEHLVRVGFTEGRNPFPQFEVVARTFDAEYYLAQNADVAEAVQAGGFRSAMEHFVHFGMYENRDPSQAFSTSYYLANNADVAESVSAGGFRSGYQHYMMHGMSEGRLGSTTPIANLGNFDGIFVTEAGKDILTGMDENTATNPESDWLMSDVGADFFSLDNANSDSTLTNTEGELNSDPIANFNADADWVQLKEAGLLPGQNPQEGDRTDWIGEVEEVSVLAQEENAFSFV
ncbi:Ig-like domain-containing protein [Laspinema palackyanum]|uniref:Ig-like domain-containing protein n=1 Tax=Laspinema palackyanum TaxID=3231601 RepID=UPI00345D1814|nr:Ig-like domain-containing protein [Laspinema sp. D2c]